MSNNSNSSNNKRKAAEVKGKAKKTKESTETTPSVYPAVPGSKKTNPEKETESTVALAASPPIEETKLEIAGESKQKSDAIEEKVIEDEQEEESKESAGSKEEKESEDSKEQEDTHQTTVDKEGLVEGEENLLPSNSIQEALLKASKAIYERPKTVKTVETVKLPLDNSKKNKERAPIFETMSVTKKTEDAKRIEVNLSLMVMALFIFEEEERVPEFGTDMLKHTEDETNPVLFAPFINHHLVTFGTMDKEFIESAYTGKGEDLNTRQMDLMVFHVVSKSSSSGNTVGLRDLTSMYPVLFRTTSKRHKFRREVLLHSDLMCGGIPNGYVNRFHEHFDSNGSLDFVAKLFRILENKTIKSIEDLIDIAKCLQLKVSGIDKNSFDSAFRFVRSSLQKKYKLGFGAFEGLHRLALAVKAATKGALCADFNLSKEKKTHTTRNLDLKATKLNQMFNVTIYIPSVTLPKLHECRQLSEHILKKQNLGVKKTIGDIFNQCLINSGSILNTFSNTATSSCYDIIYDVDEAWYGKPFLTAKTVRKSPGKKSPGKRRKKTEQNLTIDAKYSDFGRYHSTVLDLFCKKGCIVFPKLLDVLVTHGKFSYTMDQFNQSNNLDEEDNKIAIFEHCLSLTPFATENELRTKNINIRLKLPLLLKSTLEFLRCSLFTAENRLLLSNFCAADFITKDSWEQHEGANKDIGNPCNLQDLDFIAKLMHAVVASASNLTEYIMHVVDLRASKVQVRLQKLKTILRLVQFKHILQDVMKVGSNPVILDGTVESVVGNTLYKKHFAGSDKTFVAGALALYIEHVSKLKVLMKHVKNDYGKNFFKYNDNAKLKKGVFRIDTKDLSLDRITMPFDTTQMNGTYSVSTGTVVPGSFYQFCEAIAQPNEETEQRYDKFLMYEVKDDFDEEDEDDEGNTSSDESETDPYEDVHNLVSNRVRQFFTTNERMSMSAYMRIVFGTIASKASPTHSSLAKILDQLHKDYVRYINQEYDEEKEFKMTFIDKTTNGYSDNESNSE